MDKRNEQQKSRLPIVIVGVEGGGITLYGEMTESGWWYSCDFIDQTPLMLADELEQREIRRESRRVDSWDQALGLLDEMKWLGLPAVMVRREFRQKVWDAVVARLPANAQNAARLERWRERCY